MPERGEWNHMAVSYSDCGTNCTEGDAKVYINGELMGFTTDSPTLDLLSFSNGLEIGTNLMGNVDEFSIWNRGLTADEIQGLFDRQSADHLEL